MSETTINGIRCEMIEGDDGATNCHLSKRVGRKEYTGSLALAQDLGGLEDDDGNVHDIAESTLDKIEEWAVRNGY